MIYDIAAVSFFSGYYWGLRRQYDFNYAMVIFASTHAALISALSFGHLISDIPFEIVSAIPIAYSFVDLISMLDTRIFQITPRGTVLHHLLLAFCLLLYRHEYPTTISVGLLSELCVIPLYRTQQLVEEFRKNGSSPELNSKLKWNGWVLIILYFFLRVVNFSCITGYVIYQGQKIGTVASVLLTLLNYNWFYKIWTKSHKYFKQFEN